MIAEFLKREIYFFHIGHLVDCFKDRNDFHEKDLCDLHELNDFNRRKRRGQYYYTLQVLACVPHTLNTYKRRRTRAHSQQKRKEKKGFLKQNIHFSLLIYLYTAWAYGHPYQILYVTALYKLNGCSTPLIALLYVYNNVVTIAKLIYSF